MELKNVIFIDNLPKIDLHGFDRDTASLAVSDFIRDSIKLKNNIIVIIHGIGSNIVKKSVHETLKRNKFVLEYKLFPYNIGCTIVRLNIDKP